MARVLSISSQVVYGHVGNSVTAFVLQRCGHQVLPIPTVVLSNRPGYQAIHGLRLDPDALNSMLLAIEQNGWFDTLDAVLTGYMPSVAHVKVVAKWVSHLKTQKPNLFYVCDPIIGDEPAGVYIDAAAAQVLKSDLLPLCDLATPNSFELKWLSGLAFDAESVVDAAKSLGLPSVLVTSAPSFSEDRLSNVLLTQGQVHRTDVGRRIVHAHGTGDFFMALYVARVLSGYSPSDALSAATHGMESVLDASVESSELALIETQAVWGNGKVQAPGSLV